MRTFAFLTRDANVVAEVEVIDFYRWNGVEDGDDLIYDRVSADERERLAKEVCNTPVEKFFCFAKQKGGDADE